MICVKKNMKYVVFLLVLFQFVLLCNISSVLAVEYNAPTNCKITINNNDLYTKTKYVTLELFAVDESSMQVWISNDGVNGSVVDYAAGKTINITDTNYTVGTKITTANSTSTTNTNNVMRIQNWPLDDPNGNKLVYAVFRDEYGNKTAIGNLQTITISFDMNEKAGTTPASITTVKNLGVYLPNASTTQGGFNFLGWSTSKTVTIPTRAPGTMYVDTTDRTLYAVWESITYPIKYDPNGGSLGNVPSVETKTWGQDYTININTPVRDGYKFMGWATSANGEPEYQPNDVYKIEAGLTLYAVFYPIIKGNVTINGTLTYGQTVTANVSNLWPTDSNLTYQWYSNTTASTSGGSPIAKATSKSYVIGKDLADNYLYVVVNATGNKYVGTTFVDIADAATNGTDKISRIPVTIPTASTISYDYTGSQISLLSYLTNYNSGLMDIDGGSGTNADTYMASIYLKDKKNYQWTTGSTSDVYIYWTINKIDNPLIVSAVSNLRDNGATHTLVSATGAQGTVHYSTTTQLTSTNYSSASTSLPTASNAGTYTVYYYTPGNTNYKEKGGSVSVTISPSTYTVSYNANGGTGAPASQTKTHGVNLKLSTTEPTKANHSFIGWNTMADGNGTSYSVGGNYGTDANVTLYAMWGEHSIDNSSYGISYQGVVERHETVERSGSHTVDVTDYGLMTFTGSESHVYAEYTELSVIANDGTVIFQKTMSDINDTFTVDVSKYNSVRFEFYAWGDWENNSWRHVQFNVNVSNIILKPGIPLVDTNVYGLRLQDNYDRTIGYFERNTSHTVDVDAFSGLTFTASGNGGIAAQETDYSYGRGVSLSVEANDGTVLYYKENHEINGTFWLDVSKYSTVTFRFWGAADTDDNPWHYVQYHVELLEIRREY